MRTTEDRTRRRPSLRASVVASATALLLLGPGAGTAQADRDTAGSEPRRRTHRPLRGPERRRASGTDPHRAGARQRGGRCRCGQGSTGSRGLQRRSLAGGAGNGAAGGGSGGRPPSRASGHAAARSHGRAGRVVVPAGGPALRGGCRPRCRRTRRAHGRAARGAGGDHVAGGGAPVVRRHRRPRRRLPRGGRTVRAERLTLLGAAEEAKDEAAASAAEAQSLAASVAARKSELVAEVAELEGISVRLAQQRQSALEKLEQQRRDEEAAAAAAAAAAEAAAEAEAAAPQAPADAAPEPDPAPEPQSDPGSQPQPPPQPDPKPEPVPTPPSAPAPAPSGGAASAIAFARAQLGEPYVWGAEGPGRGTAPASRWPPGAPAGSRCRTTRSHSTTPPRRSRPRSCARGTWSSGARAAARRRSSTWRCTSATG